MYVTSEYMYVFLISMKVYVQNLHLSDLLFIFPTPCFNLLFINGIVPNAMTFPVSILETILKW